MRTQMKEALAPLTIMVMALILVAVSCDKHPPIPPPPPVTNIPTVETVSVTLVSADETGAVISAFGKITNDGGTTVTYRGFYLSKKKSPTIDDTVVVASGGSSFNRTINLPVNETYYLVAFATNDKGTSTGTVKSIKTDWLVKDVDGNVYHTLYLNKRWWLKEDLKTTHYRDGTAIPNITDNNDWMNLKTGAYANYNNDTSLVKTYGRLYNFYAIETGKLGIKGWHVSTENEWLELYMALGNDPHNGGKLKEVGTEHWKAPNVGATNSTGFTAIPGGDRSADGLGKFNDLGISAVWWVNESVGTKRGSVVFIDNDNDVLHVLVDAPKREGLAIRLIKNK